MGDSIYSTNLRSSAYLTTIREAITISKAICDTLGVPGGPELYKQHPRLKPLPSFSPPQPLTSRLEALGLSNDATKKVSEVYLRMAEELRGSAETSVHSAYSKVASLPRANGGMPLEILREKLYDAHNRRYQVIIASWADEMIEKIRSKISSERQGRDPNARAVDGVIHRQRKFKAEYIPLFEYAFERDRFPSREDKRQLAKISGMSYNQVSIWFQNRRCRRATRVKSNCSSKPPQTFEEMKDRLGASAREALTNSLAAKEFVHGMTPRLFGTATLNVQGAPMCAIPGEETTSEQAVSSIVPNVSDGVDEEYRDESCNDSDDSIQDNSAGFTLSTPSASPEPLAIAMNSLNPSQSEHESTVFPAIYRPAKAKFDPFIVDHTPWLRSTQGPETRRPIEPTPEALADITSGFDAMDVDSPATDCNKSTTACKELVEPVDFFLPRRRTVTSRTFSSSSSGSSGVWSSGTTSRVSSYSMASPSTLSSPDCSEDCLPTSSDCAPETPSESSPSPTPATESPLPASEESGNTQGDEVTRAGPFDSSSAESASKTRVNVWMQDVASQGADDAGSS